MANQERRGRINVNISPRNSFDLTMTTDDHRFGLAVVEPVNFGHDTSRSSQDLLRTVMLAHLIAPYFPKVIETNFSLEFEVFLSELYRHYGYRPPRLVKSTDQVTPTCAAPLDRELVQVENASAHSGGLDSVYRLVSFLAKHEAVLAVHLRNLNSKGNYAEANASRRQCQSWGIPYEQIRLKNSSGNTNFDTMRTRDLLLALMVAINASPHGVDRVVIEGGMSSDPKDTHFSEYTGAWEMFNALLKDVGLDLSVEGIDPGDIETIAEILRLEKLLGFQILSLVQNCFSAPFQVPNNRRKWERKTPHLAKNSPDHWCGSCHKCRRTTLGRIFYQDERLAGISDAEIRYFITDTYDWMKKYPHNRDLLSASFVRHLETIRNNA